MTIPLSKDRPIQQVELEAAAAKLGTTNQQERFAAGLLPEDELLALARAELFKPFETLAQHGVKRWGKDTKVRPSEIRHDSRGRCDMRHESEITYETCQAGELTHDEWEVYRLVMTARDEAAKHPWLASTAAVTIEPLAHFATCTACQAEASRMSVKATIKWAGRELVREYLLR
jgi:hypothetical protein